MNLAFRQPYLGHVLILAVLLASVGVTRAVYVDPKLREARSLHAEQERLQADLADLSRGLQDLEAWKRVHPGEDASQFASRRARPAREMVASFFREVTPIADRWRVGTELIQPAGAMTDETVTDSRGATVTYRRVELRFRFYASYRDLGEYLREVEGMDQLVVVRAVALQYNAPSYPELAADVTIWLYGTP